MNKDRMERRRAYSEMDGRTLAALVEQVEAIRAHVGAPAVEKFAAVIEARDQIKGRAPATPPKGGKK